MHFRFDWFGKMKHEKWMEQNCDKTWKERCIGYDDAFFPCNPDFRSNHAILFCFVIKEFFLNIFRSFDCLRFGSDGIKGKLGPFQTFEKKFFEILKLRKKNWIQSPFKKIFKKIFSLTHSEIFCFSCASRWPVASSSKQSVGWNWCNYRRRHRLHGRIQRSSNVKSKILCFKHFCHYLNVFWNFLAKIRKIIHYNLWNQIVW